MKRRARIASDERHTRRPSGSSLVGVALKMGISRARVHQLEQRALAKLKALIEAEEAGRV